jgi:Pyruvate/2-oxoacid:ferredoxin oxidoreductase delta subunit
MNNLADEKCQHCGGTLTWVNLPNEVWADTSKAPTYIEYTLCHMCLDCGWVKPTEAIQRLPTLEDLERETDEKRRGDEVAQ